MKQGFVKLDRAVVDNPAFRDSQALHLWVWLLTRAAWKPTRVSVGSRVVDLAAGELVFVRKETAALTGLSDWKIRTTIALLEKLKMIEKTSGPISVICIVDKPFFQDTEPAAATPPPRNHRDSNRVSTATKSANTPEEKRVSHDDGADFLRETTAKPPQNRREASGINNVFKKNKKKRIKKKEPCGAEHAALADLLREGILNDFPDNAVGVERRWNALRPDWADTVRLMMERDGRRADDIRAAIDWSRGDPFWRKVILSAAGLRRNFDRLRAEMTGGKSPPGGTGDARRRRTLEACREFINRGESHDEKRQGTVLENAGCAERSIRQGNLAGID